jgi:hypothetical protein
MKYTVVLTESKEGNYHVTVPGLPDCTIDAPSRDEALRQRDFFGAFKGQPMWGEVFDELEKKRDMRIKP